MPYRRLPKTDLARLKALKVVLDNNDVYTAGSRIIDWKTLNKAQSVFDKLFDACQQYNISMNNQIRKSTKIAQLQRNAELYLSHFVQILYMSIERGEIKDTYMELYGLTPGNYILPNLKTCEGLIENGPKIVAGEKARIKKGGMPIYNPTIAKVAVHFEIFNEAYSNRKLLQSRTTVALGRVSALRDEVDGVIFDIWNQVEKAFVDLPPQRRFDECRKYGVVYYYRRNEPHIY
jgi:hypothetical protein